MTDYIEEAPAGLAVGKAVHFAGAALSLALIAGVAVWSYDLIKRDVSGVPVVQALKGPMRVQPDDPGGRPADHQGLAVNAVAATGAAEAPADRLTLAPRPVDLAEEDATGAELAEITPEETRASIEALVKELTEDTAPLAPLAEPEKTAVLTEAVATEATIPRPLPAVLNAPGLRRSLRPQARPLQVNTLRPATLTPVDVASDELLPADLPSGTRLAQLGAFESPDQARSAWEKLAVRFDEVMEGKSLVVEEAASGGRTFYRLRAAGFDDLSDARRFCSVFVSENADCIPVTVR